VLSLTSGEGDGPGALHIRPPISIVMGPEGPSCQNPKQRTSHKIQQVYMGAVAVRASIGNSDLTCSCPVQ
jgi:hypothetical protein